MAAAIIEKPEVMLVDDREEDVEKTSRVHFIDNIRVLGLNEEDAEFYNSYSTEERRRVIRKVCFLWHPPLTGHMLILGTRLTCDLFLCWHASTSFLSWTERI